MIIAPNKCKKNQNPGTNSTTKFYPKKPALFCKITLHRYSLYIYSFVGASIPMEYFQDDDIAFDMSLW